MEHSEKSVVCLHSETGTIHLVKSAPKTGMLPATCTAIVWGQSEWTCSPPDFWRCLPTEVWPDQPSSAWRPSSSSVWRTEIVTSFHIAAKILATLDSTRNKLLSSGGKCLVTSFAEIVNSQMPHATFSLCLQTSMQLHALYILKVNRYNIFQLKKLAKLDIWLNFFVMFFQQPLDFMS